MSDERERITGDEALSALVDGELEAAERRQLVDHLLDDAELRARWARYHAGRASLEGNGPSMLGADFSERVLAAVGAEAAVLAPSRACASAARARPRAVMTAALAAGVAVVAVAVVPFLRDTGTGAPVSVVAERDPTAAVDPVAGVAAGGSGSRDAVEQARVRERLAFYLSSHNEFAAAGEMPGVMPYSRMVGFNAGE